VRGFPHTGSPDIVGVPKRPGRPPGACRLAPGLPWTCRLCCPCPAQVFPPLVFAIADAPQVAHAGTGRLCSYGFCCLVTSGPGLPRRHAHLGLGRTLFHGSPHCWDLNTGRFCSLRLPMVTRDCMPVALCTPLPPGLPVALTPPPPLDKQVPQQTPPGHNLLQLSLQPPTGQPPPPQAPVLPYLLGLPMRMMLPFAQSSFRRAQFSYKFMDVSQFLDAFHSFTARLPGSSVFLLRMDAPLAPRTYARLCPVPRAPFCLRLDMFCAPPVDVNSPAFPGYSHVAQRLGSSCWRFPIMRANACRRPLLI